MTSFKLVSQPKSIHYIHAFYFAKNVTASSILIVERGTELRLAPWNHILPGETFYYLMWHGQFWKGVKK